MVRRKDEIYHIDFQNIQIQDYRRRVSYKNSDRENNVIKMIERLQKGDDDLCSSRKERSSIKAWIIGRSFDEFNC